MIIGEYSPRRSQGEYSPIITEPEANNCFSILVLKISVLLYSPVGEYNSLIRHLNLTNQLVGFVMFTYAKILTLYILQKSIKPSSVATEMNNTCTN